MCNLMSIFGTLAARKFYRGTHQIFFSAKSYYVLVLDTREQGTDIAFWLNTIQQIGGYDSSVLILINEKHGRTLNFDEKGYRGHFGTIIKDVLKIDLANDHDRLVSLQETV